MQLVGARHERSPRVFFIGEPLEVGDLAFPPGPLLVRILGEAVGTSFDDVSDPRAELRADVAEARLATVVLGCVVEQRRDRLIFVSAALQHERRDRQQVGQVRDVGPLPEVAPVDHPDVVDGPRVPLGEELSWRSFVGHCSPRSLAVSVVDFGGDEGGIAGQSSPCNARRRLSLS